jgi:threonine 3-dehydrogenase
VLHSQSAWGGGTTEYALDAILAAHEGRHYVCPVSADTQLPMIYIDDLTRAILAISFAAKDSLMAVQSGYTISGFSFSPNDLFSEIRKMYPEFEYSFDTSANPHAADFAETWPDSLCSSDAMSDFGFQASFGLSDTIRIILTAHQERKKNAEH